ncbi:MAG: uroporphyrinogen-III synthase [Rikenellaceae bacterium]
MKTYKTAVDFHPFIKVEGVTLKEFRGQRVEILDHTAVIFSSRKTIDSFFEICEQARITIPEGMKYLCYTEAIALYLQKYIVYRKRKIFFADGTFPHFMELMIKHKDEKMLLTLSEPHKQEIPSTMERMKLNFAEVILARTVSTDLSDLDIKQYDLLVFYSPTEIKSLVAAFPLEDIPAVATFGQGTTRKAIELGLDVKTMAPSPQVPSMTKAVDIYIKQINSGKEVESISIMDKSEAEDFVKAQEAKPIKKTRCRKPAEEKAN